MNFLRNLFRKRVKDVTASCDNIVKSIAKCKTLHKKLIITAHPDKHPDKLEKAEELTKAINRARYDYSKLIELQDIVKREFL